MIKKSKLLVYVPMYAILSVLQNLDGKLLCKAIDGEIEHYICVDLISYFLGQYNNPGFSLLVLLAELGIIFAVILLCLVYAIRDDIGSVQ